MCYAILIHYRGVCGVFLHHVVGGVGVVIYVDRYGDSYDLVFRYKMMDFNQLRDLKFKLKRGMPLALPGPVQAARGYTIVKLRRNKRVIAVAVSCCAAADRFDKRVGRRVACTRLMSVALPVMSRDAVTMVLDEIYGQFDARP